MTCSSGIHVKDLATIRRKSDKEVNMLFIFIVDNAQFVINAGLRFACPFSCDSDCFRFKFGSLELLSK